MCGIAGIYRLDGELADRDLLEGMRHRLFHRGPDGRGLFHSGQVGLSHSRLKIIDLTDSANQPMTDNSLGITVSYNGEIYNYLELKEELEGLGFQFRTHSDTEVLLAGYAQWGVNCLEHFNGMFAFALWDSNKQLLFCARDRFGIKPFYYYSDSRQLAFASEIKALLFLPGISVKPNRRMIHDFLTLGLVDHTDETFFTGIVKLPPAHYLTVDADGMHIERYWDFEVSNRLEKSDSYVYETKEFRDLLEDAVRLRLRSDVPVGSCLSGGIDSTSIVCLINSLIGPEHKGRVGEYQKTYSAVFNVPSLDERPFIREVISSTKAQTNLVEPKAEEFLDELDTLLLHQEEPFVSSSMYAQWCVFRKVKESGVKVVLDGQGADEQLCGYRKFSYFLLGELARQRYVGQLFKEGMLAWKNLSYFKGVDFKHSLRYSRLGRRYVRLPSLVRSDVLMSDSPESHVNIGYSGCLAERIKTDITHFSLPSLLRYEDKNSMAFSVESRTPYLDFRLVEYLAALPLRTKIHRGWTKYILRHAMEGVIPERIRWRKDKLAFDTPQHDWLRNKWKTAFRNSFREDNILSECLDQQELFMEYNKFLSNRSRISGNFFFRAFVLQRWAQQFSIHSL